LDQLDPLIEESSTMNNKRVLLGDDHVLILEGIRAALEPQFTIVGRAMDGKMLVMAAEELRPDIVVLDISMPVLNGFESARQIKSILPSVKLVFLTQHLNPAYLRQALKIGVSGYVLKSEAADELQRAVSAVVRSKTYISPSFGTGVIEHLWNRSGDMNQEWAGLTERQRQILQLIVEGRGNKEIADTLHLSIKTIEFHRSKLMSKLGVRSAAELGKVALQQGLIPE
jgi:DNA-binding NarL/FixJ family response regulator